LSREVRKMKIKTIDIIVLIIFILTAILVFWYIFGDSPTFEQTMIGFISGAVFTIVIKMSYFNSNINREVGELKVGIKHSFINVKNNMNLLKKDNTEIKNNINLIKKKLKI